MIRALYAIAAVLGLAAAGAWAAAQEADDQRRHR